MAFGNLSKKYGYNYTKPNKTIDKTPMSLAPKTPTQSKFKFTKDVLPTDLPPPPIQQPVAPPPVLQPPTPPPITPPPAPVVKQEVQTDPNLQALAGQNTTPENVGNILANLDPALQEQIKKNILGMTSGSMFDANQALSDQSFAAQAQNMRAQGGAFNAPNIGQGAANRGQQAIEQGIMEQLSNKSLQDNVAKNQLMQQGTQFGTNLAAQNAQNAMQAAQLASSEKQNAMGIISNEKLSNEANFLTEKLAQDANYLQQQGIDSNNAHTFGYTDANGNHVKGTLEMQTEQMDSLMKSQAGEGFSSYLSANLNSDINDPAVQQLGQKLWESFGNQGQAPKWWVDQRIAAVRDPALTNPIVGTQKVLQEAVDAGIVTQDQFDSFMGEFTKQMLDISGTSTTPTTTNGANEQSEINKMLSDEESFDEFATTLPDSIQDPNLEVADWVDIGKPNAEDFNKWYKKNDGEDYLKIKESIPNVEANMKDTDDWWKGVGKYAGQNVSGKKLHSAENNAILRSKISAGIGEKELEDQITSIHKVLGKYTSNGSGIYSKKEKAKMVKDGYTEKQIDEMTKFVKLMRDTRALQAFGYKVTKDNKNKTYKLDNIVYS